MSRLPACSRVESARCRGHLLTAAVICGFVSGEVTSSRRSQGQSWLLALELWRRGPGWLFRVAAKETSGRTAAHTAWVPEVGRVCSKTPGGDAWEIGSLVPSDIFWWSVRHSLPSVADSVLRAASQLQKYVPSRPSKVRCDHTTLDVQMMEPHDSRQEQKRTLCLPSRPWIQARGLIKAGLHS